MAALPVQLSFTLVIKYMHPWVSPLLLLLCLFGFDPILKAYFNHEIVLAYSSAAVGCGICYFHAIGLLLAGLHVASR